MNQQTKSGKCYIVQDENSTGILEQQHFDPAYWQGRSGVGEVDGGRGGSVKIDLNGKPAILRRFLRGGMVAHLSRDFYLWLGVSRTRPWREWAILQQALELGLPVPRPLAIYAQRSGLTYRAAIITEYLDDTETLARYLTNKSLEPAAWYRLGTLLKQFQSQGFRHADLNATNLLIDKKDEFHIIDFDKARRMKQLGDWQWSVLFRLQRSLEKTDKKTRLNYRQSDWQMLMDGYQASDK